MENTTNTEDIMSYLFALRIALQDDCEDESDIIQEFKNYLLSQDYNMQQIKETINDFYNLYGIQIPDDTFMEDDNTNDDLPHIVPQDMLSNLLQNIINIQPSQEEPYIFSIPIINSQLNFTNLHPDPYNTNIVSLFSTFINQTEQNLFDDVVVTVDDKDLESLKTTKLDNNLETSCSICLSQMIKDETITELKCSHLFHSDCIKPYLEQYNYKCPVCRSEVGKPKYNI